MSDILQDLNPAQRHAVVNFEHPSLIVAGAGSGKTRVLTCRIAYMLSQGVDPSSILALTFTNKAAKEMRERISRMVDPGQARRLWMGTFHSVFARILRAEAAALGFPATFTIYDTADSRNLVRRIIKEMNLPDETSKVDEKYKYKSAEVLARISLAKNNLITATAYEANTNLIAEDRQRNKPETVNIYKEYIRKCREFGAMDFDDLLLNINILFRDHPEITARYRQSFKYILVDEYQDTNYAQYIIIRRLAEGHSRVCVVGDDAQSIYSFRGAKIENILRFQSDFPDARTFKLEQNYRSTKTIVSAANSLIEKNVNRIKKESFSEGQQGERIKVMRAYTDREEASMVCDELQKLVRQGGGEWSDAAILYRTNAQSRTLEETLRRRSIPYKIYGGTSFFQRKEVKDMVAYIRLTVNPRDEESLRRVINFPARGIGDVTVERVAAAAAGIGMMEAIRTLDPAAMGLNAGAGKKIREFGAMIGELSLQREQLGLYEFGNAVATRSGILALYKDDQSPESMSALDNIEELLNSMHTFTEEYAAENEGVEPAVEEWLQNIALLTDADNEDENDRNHVTLMTVHSAKGLEFKYVMIAGMEENLFPNQMGMGTPEGLEEERRLLYVAITRAGRVAVLSFAQQRFKWGQMTFSRPSRFLSEIDPRYLEVDFPLEDTGMDAPEDPVAEMRRRYDHRQKSGYGGRSENPGGYGNRSESYGRGGSPEGGPGRGDHSEARRQYRNRYDKPDAPRTPAMNVAPPRPEIAGMRKIGVRPAPQNDGPANLTTASGLAPAPSGTAAARGAQVSSPPAGAIGVGTRVEHPKFGRGEVTLVERMAGDVKLTIDFGPDGKRTLLQKFAKLTII